MKNQVMKHGTMFVMAVSVLTVVLTGCVFNLPYRAKLEVTVMENINEIQDGGDIFFNVGGSAKTFSAAVAGAEADATVSYEWSLVKGNGVVMLAPTEDGKTAAVTPQTAGDAKIRVKAGTNYDVTAETYFNIYVNPSGNSGWTFKILDGSTEIYHNDDIEIPPANIKNIVLEKTTGDTVTFSIHPVSGAAVSLSSTSPSNAFTVTGLKFGRETLSITATKGSEHITKAVTVYVAESGVLFAWDSVTNPMETIAANTVRYGGYRDIYLAARRSAVTAPSGAMVLGTGSEGNLLVIGAGSQAGAGTPAGAQTSATAYIPGQFDLSVGTFRLTVDYSEAVLGSGNDVLLRICINNNGSGSANSVLDGNSVLRSYTSEDQLNNGRPDQNNAGLTGAEVPGKVVLTFTPSIRYANSTKSIQINGQEAQAKDSLKTAFLSLQSYANNSVIITGIRLERVN